MFQIQVRRYCANKRTFSALIMSPVVSMLLLGVLCLENVTTKLLFEEETCDISRLCTSKSVTTELDALECVQNVKATEVSPECQKTIREHAVRYFEDNNVKRELHTYCQDELQYCDNDLSNRKYIVCILDQKKKIENLVCDHAIRRLEYVVAADFTLVSEFVDACLVAMKTLKCDITHSQLILRDDRLDCLQQNVDQIQEVDCYREVLHLSEIQGEDIRSDMKLFSACSLDRHRLCSSLPKDATYEMIYKCLIERVSDTAISPTCQEQLLKREKLVTKDAKVSRGLVRACRDDIRFYHCRRLVSEDKGIRLAQMLVCLENAAKNGSKIGRECQAEMIQHRKLLMEDYRLSPEVVSHCSNDIDEYCSGLEVGGRTIHCLMEHSRLKRRKDRVSPPCQKALHSLLKMADVAEDWRIDPVIHLSCLSVVNKLCSDIPGGNSRVMMCLFDHIGNRYMNPRCETALIQLQYFVSRDFRLDPQLYHECYSDAVRLCRVSDSWEDTDKMLTLFKKSKLVLPCLFRYVYNEDIQKYQQVTENCVKEVKRVMRQRALSVELMPEVETACIDDLALYCHDKTGIGEEMMCLQDRYQALRPECKSAVGNFTEGEVADIDLNPIISTHCASAIKTFCLDQLRNKLTSGDGVMSCLIEHKNDAQMKVDYKCRASVEHFQLITLNDYRFTVAFKQACRVYVLRYCPKARTKAQVVECLSEVVRNDTITEEKHKIPKQCRYQLRTQLLQQREFIDLDPQLKLACEMDIKKFCKNVPHGGSKVLECLEDNVKKLSKNCHKAAFKIQQQDFTDSSTDYMLMSGCKFMIKQYCDSVDLSQSFSCLKKYKDEPEFDRQCRNIVSKRMLEQSLDYRLDPSLQIDCKQDIAKFCIDIVRSKSSDDVEFEGKVIKCLKVKFRERKLHKACENQVSIKLKEEALNYKLNPLLRNLCTREISNLCNKEVLDEENGQQSGRVEECLKVAFLDGHILNRACQLEVAGLIEETKADIHVDPLLHQACIGDIQRHCAFVIQGSGRILKCLQDTLNSDGKYLQADCKQKLQQRMEMFKNADTLLVAKAPKDFQQLLEEVRRSNIGWYVTSLLLCVVTATFCVGLVCGKITRRSAQLKNR